jgi:hypothetical protein
MRHFSLRGDKFQLGGLAEADEEIESPHEADYLHTL